MKKFKIQKDLFKTILPILISESVIVEDAIFGDTILNIHDLNKIALKEILACICKTQLTCQGCPIYTIYNGQPPLDCKRQPHIMLRLLQDKITCPKNILATQETLSLL